ncbi:hypothetical protein BGZ65_003870 [Modicella reniformis]|uniref:BZIP domain-containing protein n=1 Tax=Modicella reniformis TaxID=1440133 RepID=A0A9P6MHR1_9FUNG|nr:hypothetical protein BGZ65_003870 [Modicella reniformis]
MGLPNLPLASSHDDAEHHPSQDRKHKLSDEDEDLDQEDQEDHDQEDQDSEQEQDHLDGPPSPNSSGSNKEPKRMGRRPNAASPTLRKEQNRAAQRAFRVRKERHLQQLENMIRDLREQQRHITVHFQQEVKQLTTRLQTTNVENHYLREVVFAFETTLSKGGYVTVLQDVKQSLHCRYNEQAQPRTAMDPIHHTINIPWQVSESGATTSSSQESLPHPLTMSLSKADPSYEMGLNREILYRAPPLFVSIATENGQVLGVKSPLGPLLVSRPSYIDPGTHLPKHTDYTKHPTVFDELQSSLFPPGTLQSLAHSSMATPQEVVNDVTPFDHSIQHQEENEAERLRAAAAKRQQLDDDNAYTSKWGLDRNHRLHKEISMLMSSSPAVDPKISPQLYELPHDTRIDLVPCPKLRAQMILHQNKYDVEELFQLLISKAVCHGHPLDVSSWELPDEFFDRFGFLMGLDMERIRRKVWPRKLPQDDPTDMSQQNRL